MIPKWTLLLCFLLLVAGCATPPAAAPSPTPSIAVVEVSATTIPATEEPAATATIAAEPTEIPATVTVAEEETEPATSTTANGGSTNPTMSGDGRFVVFESTATNLTADTNEQECDSDNDGVEDSPCSNIYLFDRATSEITLISQSPSHQPFDGNSFFPVISDDAHYIAYMSYASNASADGPTICEPPGQQNICINIFVHDRATTETYWVSRPPTESPYGASIQPTISSDGRFIAFASFADNLVPDDTNGAIDVFVYEPPPRLACT